jgi:hypothetical protein
MNVGFLRGLLERLDETATATAKGGNEQEKTMHSMSKDWVMFRLSMVRERGEEDAPCVDDPDGVPVEIRERMKHHLLLLQARIRRELCERGYVQQDQPDSDFFHLL